MESLFEDLLRIYDSSCDAKRIDNAKCFDLLDDINLRWGIFAKDVSRKLQIDILKSLTKDAGVVRQKLFDGDVFLPGAYEDDFLRESTLLRGSEWNQFADEIKIKNRYYSRVVNTELLQKYCSYIRKLYKKGSVFYRARISKDKEGFHKAEEMGAPPVGKSSDGRINAKGITCLYLADTIETTFHEVRAAAFDYVTVAKFKLKEDVFVVDLNAITNVSPFSEDMDIKGYAIDKDVLRKLNEELSKPVRRNDSTLEYVPTQYFADIIKSFVHRDELEFVGIEYTSTLETGGKNLAIFYPELFEYIDSDVYEVNKLNYCYKKVTT